MIAQKISLLTGLLEFDRRQFIIPIYQRKYKWTSEQCNRLIDDMIKAGQTKKEHFTGTVVYQEPSAGSFKQAFLVDGQQRITTSLLMVKALNIISLVKKDSDPDYKYVYDSTQGLLFADSKDVKKGMKLRPSKNDEKTFNLIMGSTSYEEIKQNQLICKGEEDYLFNNFKTIYERFLKMNTSGDVVRNIIFEGMLLLTIVEMSLGVEDDPQAIFESINSLGLNLSNSDLIRNYLLMSNIKQKELYENYWEVIQDTFIKENNMESFVFNYLMMKKSYVINSSDIYKEYVQFASDEFKGVDIDKEKLLQDLYKVAKIYQPFIRNSNIYSINTNMLMQELRDMAQTTAYPFLMKVFLDKENNVIDEDILDKVINLIIVYLVRRTICGVPTHSLRGFMLNLYNRVYKVETNKQRYFEALYAFLSQLETNDRMRRIDEVSEALKTAELYKNVKFATYLLYKIENGRYPKAYGEFTLANNVSVEHIMPQTLTDEWIAMLGDNAEEIHKTFLNTLGNLSLSSRTKNSIMSNENFITKRDVLMKSGSKFIELNKDIKAEQKIFSKDEIEKREERLSEIVCSKFDLGTVNVEGIKFEDSVEVVCSTDYEEVFNFTTPIAYKLFGTEVPTDSFSKIIVGVARELLARNPEKMRDLAINMYNPWDGGEKDCIHYTLGDNDKDQLIGEDIRIHTNYSSVYCVQFTTLLMEQFNVDASQLIIYLKKDSVKSDNVLPKKKRVENIRNTLTELSNEKHIIYSPQNMPKSDDWIKFKTKELDETFPFNELTKWDGEQFPSISYLEYNLSSNKVYITFKMIKKSESISDKLKKFFNELKLNEANTGNYWHLKEYDIDYKKIYDSNDKKIAMKQQLIDVLTMIKKDLHAIKEIIEQ